MMLHANDHPGGSLSNDLHYSPGLFTGESLLAALSGDMPVTSAGPLLSWLVLSAPLRSRLWNPLLACPSSCSRASSASHPLGWHRLSKCWKRRRLEGFSTWTRGSRRLGDTLCSRQSMGLQPVWHREPNRSCACSLRSAGCSDPAWLLTARRTGSGPGLWPFVRPSSSPGHQAGSQVVLGLVSPLPSRN